MLVASSRNKGKEIEWEGKKYVVKDLVEALECQPDIAIFSAGGSISKEWAPKFAAIGTTVIDNSSAWRMDAIKN